MFSLSLGCHAGAKRQYGGFPENLARQENAFTVNSNTILKIEPDKLGHAYRGAYDEEHKNHHANRKCSRFD
jgi:hypothetical protein